MIQKDKIQEKKESKWGTDPEEDEDKIGEKYLYLWC